MLLQDVWFLEKLAHFDREVIPERRMHAKGSGAFGKFTVTHDITAYTKAALFSEIGKETEVFVRFSTVAGERGAGDLFRLMKPEQQEALFGNTARAMGDIPDMIKIRHIKNCLKADENYGKGVARALGIDLDKVV